ncbi:MAG: Gfo/Idh/MocA family oxidoreductase, partial [Gemmatimonadetes bacterium]|nr:Gfo/Idh/MocA family oxidoreductase [Gemmatimonadota bacterium]
MTPIRLAFLGCGLAARLHSRTLRHFSDVERSYASRTRDRAEEYRGRFKGARAFGSYETALGDPEIDVVLVATPPASHLDLTLRSLAAGKHVIVEKPPFLRAADFDAVTAAAAQAGKRVFVAENYFYKPMAEALREVEGARVVAVAEPREEAGRELAGKYGATWHPRLEDVLDRADVPLAPLTTLRLGGPARRLVTAYDEPSVIDVVRGCDDAGEPLLVLGGGSNVVLPDEGIAGTVVRVAVHGLSAQQDGDRVLLTAAAGEEWESFVGLCVADRLAGVEALSGIPGLVGGSPVQNIGAYGQDVAQTITSVRAYDRQPREVVALTDCGFSYRHSVFKAEPGRWVVLAVTFALTSSE